MARIERGKEVETLERLNKFYKSYNPGFPWITDSLTKTTRGNTYRNNVCQRCRDILRGWRSSTPAWDCLDSLPLPLNGLKEIGIRKILGSSDFGIVRLLSGDFTRTVLTAIVIALPVSYFMTRKWLDEFAYRIDLEWWFFVGSGVLALLIAWFTVGLQTISAARVNPTQCIKDE